MLTLFHDYTDPASAVAAFRLQRLADEGLAVDLVGFEAVGVDVDLPVTLDVIAAIGALVEEAAAEGLALRRPASLPPTGRAHVLEEIAREDGLGASWRATCYRAYWEHGTDIGDVALLEQLAIRAGLDGDRARTALRDRRLLVEARRRTASHRGAGVGGVPTILAHQTLVPGLLAEADLRALAS